jgi:hypothetical protein
MVATYQLRQFVASYFARAACPRTHQLHTPQQILRVMARPSAGLAMGRAYRVVSQDPTFLLATLLPLTWSPPLKSLALPILAAHVDGRNVSRNLSGPLP